MRGGECIFGASDCLRVLGVSVVRACFLSSSDVYTPTV